MLECSVSASGDNWDDTVEEIKLKFPKETRNAVQMMLNKQKCTSICKICQDRKHKSTVFKDNETQTSPCRYQPEEGWRPADRNPCVKNLLCEKGEHLGRCTRHLRRSKVCYDPDSCNRCPCHEGLRWKDSNESTNVKDQFLRNSSLNGDLSNTTVLSARIGEKI